MSEQGLKECLLCNRIDYNQVALYCFQLWDDENDAKEICRISAELIRDAYLKKPYILCGKKPSCLIGASIYIAQYLYFDKKYLNTNNDKNEWNSWLSSLKTQVNISKCINITSPSIRKNMVIISEIIGIDMEHERFHNKNYIKNKIF